MSEFSGIQVRGFLLRFLDEKLANKGYPSEEVKDDFDLLIRGVIDSLGFLEMLVALQEEFEVDLDFDEIDPEKLSIVGPLCQYIISKTQERTVTANA